MSKKLIVKSLWEEGNTTQEIINKTGLSRSGVYFHLIGIFGIKRDRREKLPRKYQMNESYFETIDTEDKAYFLGLLYADGSIDSKSKRTNLSLKEEDKHILEDFSIQLETNRPLVFKDLKKMKSKWAVNSQYQLVINSLKMYKDLNKKGLFSKKSLTLKFPTEEQVPNNLLPHFIRGVFDGDGCFYRHLKIFSNVSINFALSENFSNSLKEYFSKSSITSRIKFHNNCYYLIISGGKNVYKVYNLMYKNATFNLNRKRIKFETWVRERNSKKFKLKINYLP